MFVIVGYNVNRDSSVNLTTTSRATLQKTSNVFVFGEIKGFFCPLNHVDRSVGRNQYPI